MTPICHQVGLLRYVRQQRGDAPPSKFQLWHLFILAPKFYCFYIKPNVFVI